MKVLFALSILLNSLGLDVGLTRILLNLGMTLPNSRTAESEGSFIFKYPQCTLLLILCRAAQLITLGYNYRPRRALTLELRKVSCLVHVPFERGIV